MNGGPDCHQSQEPKNEPVEIVVRQHPIGWDVGEVVVDKKEAPDVMPDIEDQHESRRPEVRSAQNRQALD